MSRDETERAVRAWFAAADAHDLAAFGAAVAEDYVWRLWDATTTGRAVSEEAWRLLFEAFPDLRIAADAIAADEGRAGVRFHMAGTHRGPLRFRGTGSMDRPFPPTGKRFRIEGAAWFEVRAGRVCLSQAYWRPEDLLRQLGLSP